MDLPTIKTKDEQATGAAGKAAGALQLGNIAATFNEIVKKSGAMLKTGSSVFAQQMSLIAPSERAEAPRPAKDDPYDSRKTVSRDDDRRVRRDEDRPDETAPRRADAAADRPREAATKDDGAPKQDVAEAPQRNTAATDDGPTTQDKAGESKQVAQKVEEIAPKDVKTARPLDELDPDAEAAVQTAAVAAAPVQAAAAPQAVATDGVTVEAAVRAAAATEGGTGKAQNAAKPGEHGLDAKGQANVAANPQMTPAADAGEASGGAAGDKAAQQTAALARALGGGHATDADAPAADGASTAGGQTAASTSPSTSAINDANRANQHGQQGGANGGNANQAMMQAAQAAAQAQTAQQTATGQQAAGADAKAGIQGVQGTGPTSAHVAGGEALPGQPGNTAETAHSQRTAGTHAPQASRFAQTGPGFADQISVQISKAAAEGLDRINIQLRPAELGRIQVELKVASDGQVSATITADNRTTLDMLQRDAKQLEQALQNAGLDLNSGDLTFNLRERHDQGQPDGNGRFSGLADRPAIEEPPLEELLNPAYRGQGVRADGRIDILT